MADLRGKRVVITFSRGSDSIIIINMIIVITTIAVTVNKHGNTMVLPHHLRTAYQYVLYRRL